MTDDTRKRHDTMRHVTIYDNDDLRDVTKLIFLVIVVLSLSMPRCRSPPEFPFLFVSHIFGKQFLIIIIIIIIIIITSGFHYMTNAVFSFDAGKDPSVDDREICSERVVGTVK